MGVFDLLIVYLAFGAPFAVADYIHRNDPVRALVVFVFWPSAALKLANRWWASRTSAQPKFDGRTARIFEKLQREITASPVSALEFRGAFERYVGLSFEVRRDDKPPDTKSAELLRISGRENTAAASASLGRRNAARLTRHHTDARERFLEMMERSQKFNAIMLALELATVLDDAEAQQYLTRAIGHDGTKGEVWDTAKQESSKERIAA